MSNPTKPDEDSIYTKKEKRVLLVVLAIVATAVLAVDAILFVRVGSAVANALSASYAGIGGFLLMLGPTSKTGLTKWEWRNGFLALGGLLVGLGGGGVALAAWMAFFEQLGPTV
jgi:hypothetical protein